MGVPLSSLFSLSLLLTSALPPLESSMALSATTATHPNMTSGMRVKRMASKMKIFAQAGNFFLGCWLCCGYWGCGQGVWLLYPLCGCWLLKPVPCGCWLL